MARQLGVDADAVPDELRSHARVSEPLLEARLAVDRARRGLFQRARPLSIHVLLAIVDASGPRLARLCSWSATARRGEVALTLLAQEGEERVRYTRPAHFLVVALATEGAAPENDERHRVALAAVAQLRIAVPPSAGEAKTIDALGRGGLAALEAPAAVRLFTGAEPLVDEAALTFVAAAVQSVPAVHRVKTTLALPLASADARLRATLLIDARL
jgi:hypothetical protein